MSVYSTPLGIASTPAVFQRTMDKISQGVQGIACYIDDIIVTRITLGEHLQHLEEVLKHLLSHRVRVNWLKCCFLQSSVSFFRHWIDTEGIHPLEGKADSHHLSSKTAKCARAAFLPWTIINYYGKFIPNAATILAPLNKLFCKVAKWKWSDQCQQSLKSQEDTDLHLCPYAL